MHKRLVFCFREGKRSAKKRGASDLTGFRVPEKVGPIGIRLHLPEDEEFSQAEVDYSSRYLRCVVVC